MQDDARDSARLLDMLTPPREIASFVQGMTFAEFEREKVKRYAVERQLLVVGEAARHVSAGFRSAHPDIPWTGIVGLRNILAHEYGEILVERIWVAATERAPALIEALEALLGDPDSGN